MNQLDNMQLDKQNSILKLMLCYLLFERKQESELAIAFSMLAQERHNQFHTTGGHKLGDASSINDEQTSFGDCDNEICVAAMAVLLNSRSMAIEINDLTTQMISGYEFKLAATKTSCRAWLQPKENFVQSPKLIIPGEEGNA